MTRATGEGKRDDDALAPPRLTLWGYLYIIRFLGLPVLGVALLLDILLYVLMRFGFERCYGLLCLLD